VNLNLNDSVAVVLGSSAGVGFAIASELASEGCKVIMCARNSAKLEEAANIIRDKYRVPVMFKSVDLSDGAQVKLFFNEVYKVFPAVDILINNTGGPKPSDLIDLTDDDYQKAFELILMSKIRACRIVASQMISNRKGKIINIESTSIKSVMPGMGLSNIFRSASNSFIKTLAAETVGKGIHVHTVMLGPFLTDRLKELGEAAAKKSDTNYDSWLEAAVEGTPMKRFGNPNEVGSLVAFLASEKSNYMNGLCIAIDGGITQILN
jgi:3-oxoacyl-[acyl-carrier protein] reductase